MSKDPWHPSKKAIRKVKNPYPVATACHHCGGEVSIKHHVEIYGKAYGEWPWAYGCNACDAYVGMHPFTNIPLGSLADKATRDARKRCKAPFESLYQSGRFKSGPGLSSIGG